MWLDMENRWRVVSGLENVRLQGLDVTQAESIMSIRGVKRKERKRILDGLLTMEAAAIAAMYGDNK